MNKSEAKRESLPGNEFADGPVGRFMAWFGETPTAFQIIAPGAIVGGIAFVCGAGPWSLAYGGAVSALFASGIIQA